jgi:hypothetical protein
MIAEFYIESLHEENTMNRIPHLAGKIILKLAREIPLLALELLRKNLENNSVIHRAIEVATSLRSEAIIGYNMRQDIQMGFFRSNFSFAIPSILAVKEICAFAGSEQILEVGSGLGLWASLIQLNGGKIIPTDSFTTNGTVPEKTFIPVIEIDAVKAVEEFPSSVLMLCWPTLGKRFAANSLEAFKGDKLVYIGEGADGCCADYRFFEILDKEWECDYRNMMISIPSWHHIYDNLYFYTRKPKVEKYVEPLIGEKISAKVDHVEKSSEDSQDWIEVKYRKPKKNKVPINKTVGKKFR